MHPVPVNAETGLCSVPYDTAEDQGYFKIDFLNVGIYKGVRDEQHLIDLMNQEPIWELLTDSSFNSLLFHVNGNSSILNKLQPKSIEQLAAVLAMIRPAKRYLIEKDWTTIMNEVWVKPSNGDYFFKKSHATAYAVAIVVQMNLICEGVDRESL